MSSAAEIPGPGGRKREEASFTSCVPLSLLLEPHQPEPSIYIRWNHFLHPLETQDREQREADKDMVSPAVFKKGGGGRSLASVLHLLQYQSSILH